MVSLDNCRNFSRNSIMTLVKYYSLISDDGSVNTPYDSELDNDLNVNKVITPEEEATYFNLLK